MSDPHEVKPSHSDDGDGCAPDSTATRLDLSELRKRIEDRCRRPVPVIWVERVLARSDPLDAPIQELIDTPGLLDRDSAIRRGGR